MAKSQKLPKKTRAKKPEFSVYVVAPKKTQPAKKSRKQPPLPKRQKFKISRQRLRLFVFFMVVAAIVVFCAGYIVYATNQATNSFNQAAKAADDFNTTDPLVTSKTKIIGSNELLANEIGGYATAPADLQRFVLSDYRKLKLNCIVNGSVYSSLSYQIVSIADAEYAAIDRNCNGSQTRIIKKFGDVWTVVYEGNTPPKCSLVNDLQLPRRVTLNCTTGGTMYLNPNP